jgi:pimeloyl-ACP methyl ester carboxylesterase
MMASPRTLAKGGFLLGVILLAATGFGAAWLASWRADRLAALDSASQVVETSVGRVEFLRHGEGPALLIIHGTPGGYDQAMLWGSSLVEEDFEIIAPSRPGYLRTPLSAGRRPAEQADTLAALIDTLGIPGVAILASSSGARVAVEFAVRHPEKLWALVLVSAVTGEHEDLKSEAKPEGIGFPALAPDAFTNEIGGMLCLEEAERNPRRIIPLVLEAGDNRTAAERDSLASYVLDDTEQLEWLKSLIGTFVPFSARQPGLRNDVSQFRDPPDLPVEKITAPTLLIHGTADKIAPIAQAWKLASRIPGAVLYPVEGAGHLVEIGPGAAEVQKKIAQFLRQHSGR